MRLTTPLRIGLVGVAALVMAACGADDDPTNDTTPLPSPAPTTAPPFTDEPAGEETAGDPSGDWVASSARLDDGEIDLIAGWDVTVSIDGDQIGGTAACNGYGGTATIGDDGSFSVGEVAITEMGCQPDVQALEQAFVAALGEFDEFAVDADVLTLRGAGHEWTFDRLAPVDDAAVVGTTWVLDTYISGDAATNVPGMDRAMLRLDADGTFTGSTGCRPLSGEWIEAGSEIVFTSFGAEGECTPDLQELDDWVVTVLGDGFRPTVEGNRLTLLSQGGEGLSYVAAADG